jgi:hypothetical protein
MVCLRMALLVGAVTAAVVSPAAAHFRKAPCCNDPCGSAPCGAAPCAPTAGGPAPGGMASPAGPAAPAAPAAPAFRTITVTECVPETYTVNRTAYRSECRTETYTACKTVCSAEVRQRTCNVVKRVPVNRCETRRVCKHVTVWENRTVCRTEWRTVQETQCKKQLVRLGHWECQQVAACGGLFGGGGKHGRHGCGNSCSNSCDPCATTSCTPTRTKKVWVHCPEYCTTPVTVCRKVRVSVPTVCKVAVCKTVWENVQVNVCTYQCVNETRVENYTVMVPRTVNYQATRTVQVCVPYQQTVTCTRMVARQVTRQVPCAAPSACDNCSNNCSNNCCETRSGFRGLFNRGGRGGHCHHHSACSSCCN